MDKITTHKRAATKLLGLAKVLVKNGQEVKFDRINKINEFFFFDKKVDWKAWGETQFFVELNEFWQRFAQDFTCAKRD
jgi:hypothetical protein